MCNYKQTLIIVQSEMPLDLSKIFEFDACTVNSNESPVRSFALEESFSKPRLSDRSNL